MLTGGHVITAAERADLLMPLAEGWPAPPAGMTFTERYAYAETLPGKLRSAIMDRCDAVLALRAEAPDLHVRPGFGYTFSAAADQYGMLLVAGEYWSGKWVWGGNEALALEIKARVDFVLRQVGVTC